MSYMDNNTLKQPGIQELSFNEIGEVDGGLAPLAIAGIALAVVFVAGVAVGFAGEHNRDTNEAQKAEG